MRIFLLKNREILENLATKDKTSFYLNEVLGASLRLTPAGPRKSAPKIAPGDSVRENLAANPEPSPLIARFPLSYVPFTQFAG